MRGCALPKVYYRVAVLVMCLGLDDFDFGNPTFGGAFLQSLTAQAGRWKVSNLPGGYKNLYTCYLQGSEVPSCIVRNQLTLHLAMYENFTALLITNVQVFVATR